MNANHRQTSPARSLLILGVIAAVVTIIATGVARNADRSSAAPDGLSMDRPAETVDELATPAPGQALSRSSAAEHESAPAVAAEQPDPVFRFVDRKTQEPLPATVVRLSSNEAPQPVGQADTSGLFQLVSPARDDADGFAPQCLATAEGYAPSSFVGCVWPGARDGEVQVVPLDRAERILGVASISDGRTIPAGVLALAWPHDYGPPTQKSRTEILDDPLISRSDVAPDGTFVLDGISPNKFYSVTAGGSGWVSGGIKRGVQSKDPGPVMLSLGALYGTVVNLQGADGSPIRLNAGYGGRGYGTTYPPDGRHSLGPVSWTAPQVALCLAGATLAEDFRDNPWIRAPMLAKGVRRDAIVPSKVPCRFKQELPGYGPLDLTLDCHWLGEELVEHSISIPSTGVAFGSVRLAREEDAPLGRGARLVLRPKDDRWREIFFRSQGAEPGRGGVTWHGIPEGYYEILYAGDVMAEAIPAAIPGTEGLTYIAGGSLTSVSLQSETSDVVLDVRRGAAPYAGTLQLRCTEADGTFAFWSFESPPYVLDSVLAGEYELEVLSPRYVPVGTAPGPPETIELTVTDGEDGSVVVNLGAS